MTVLGWVGMVAFFALTIKLFLVVNSLSRWAFKDPPPDYRERLDRMLIWVGLWQWGVGFLIAFGIPGGHWYNSIALFMMGGLVMLTPRLQRTLR